MKGIRIICIDDKAGTCEPSSPALESYCDNVDFMKVDVLVDIIRLNRHCKRLITYNKGNVCSPIARRLTIKVASYACKTSICKKLHRRSGGIIEE